MKSQLGLVLAAAIIVAGCDKQPTPPPAPAPKESSGNPITAPVDYIAAVGKAQELAMKKIDVASITSAVQLFFAQEGRYPKDLNELVKEKYLTKLPPVPYKSTLKYDPATGEVKVVKE